jgi:hypothetical protein
MIKSGRRERRRFSKNRADSDESERGGGNDKQEREKTSAWRRLGGRRRFSGAAVAVQYALDAAKRERLPPRRSRQTRRGNKQRDDGEHPCELKRHQLLSSV